MSSKNNNNNNNELQSDSDDSAVMVDYKDIVVGASGSAVPALADEDNEKSKIITPEKMKEEGQEGTKKKKSAEKNEKPTAHQIVSIGTEDDAFAFDFDQEALNSILKRIPIGWEVAVVSVVGAFRTGKSFLLSWFLRYLHCLENSNNNSSVEVSKDATWYEQFESLGNDGFEWKAGSERNTTGIWMWSHPHFIQRGKGSKKPLAVLLVDTQGMFDHETTMSLTASIFGFSTLLSSFQIYNVDKRIQEDNLQQLALFSEYARTAMGTEEKEKEESTTKSEKKEEEPEKDETGSSSTPDKSRCPFQQIEFLVRDWQHYEEDEEDFEAMEKSMADYLEKVIAERDATDLKETREQILSCFDKVSCYGLCHPGFAVTKKKYSGDVKGIEPLFLQLLDRYCKRIFDPSTLEAKQIHGRFLTAAELGSYVQAYAALFASGAKFPTAATLLEATVSANNTNAIELAMTEYKNEMDRVAGPQCNNFIKQDVFEEEHRRVLAKSLQVFESIATFGSTTSIQKARNELQNKVDESHETYESLNKGRNPLLGLETYIIPLAVGLTAYLLRILTDFVCSPYSTMCKTGSDFLAHTHAAIWCFLAILASTKFKEIKDVFDRVMVALDMIMQPPNKKKEKTK